ncbi:hypothetical protein [Bradyrhizobium sp.]|jgi:hypothetical protein|uniref:hypothetical protein n=1 Tax=Bradyrhizobium sp. TaxID=376 RepID=UPI003D0A9207
MPVDAMLVSAAVISMFVVFACALAWGDFQTRTAGQKAAAPSQQRRGNQPESGVALRSLEPARKYG